MADDAPFLRHRPLVVRLAYDITGSWADAEDVAQQAYLRWRGVTADVANPRAYLARIATNLALDAVTRPRRVDYVGPYLPEPVPTGPGADAALEVAAEVEVALMVVLESLSPLERAAFLLHDVFDFSHAEVARMLDREPAAVRQLTSRARRHVQARRPDPGPVADQAVSNQAMPNQAVADRAATDQAALATLTETFLQAAREGDLETLQRQLCADAVFIGDGGGRRPSALRPVSGAEKVARLLVGLGRNLGDYSRLEIVEANRRLALVFWAGDEIDTVVWLVLSGGLVSQILAVRNPDKLVALAAARRSSA